MFDRTKYHDKTLHRARQRLEDAEGAHARARDECAESRRALEQATAA